MRNGKTEVQIIRFQTSLHRSWARHESGENGLRTYPNGDTQRTLRCLGRTPWAKYLHTDEEPRIANVAHAARHPAPQATELDIMSQSKIQQRSSDSSQELGDETFMS